MLTTRHLIFAQLAVAALVLVSLAALGDAKRHCQGNVPSAETLAMLDQKIESLRALGDTSLQFGAWLSNTATEHSYAVNSHAVIPAASSIKVALLIEFFAENSDRLDEPLRETTRVLRNSDSPAVRHFDAETLQDIRHDLSEMTTRQIGEVMIGKNKTLANASYNAAANVVIAVLGGPAAATQRIRERHADVRGLTVSRFMLADRNETGDNLTTLNDLAVIHRSLALRDLPNIDIATIDSIRDVLKVEADDDWQHYYKGGTLSSNPQVRIEAGWLQSDSPRPENSRVLVYAFAAVRNQDAIDREADIEILKNSVASLSEIVRLAWLAGEPLPQQ